MATSHKKRRTRGSSLRIAGREVELIAPGLRKTLRGTGDIELYWVADRDAVKRGYPTKTARIFINVDDPAAAATIEKFCQDRQAEMLIWLDGSTDDRERLMPKFDGTLGSLIDGYESHADSAYAAVRDNTREGYKPWLKMLRTTVGARRIDRIVPLDFRRWHREWKAMSTRRGTDGTRQAYGGIQALGLVLNFGIECSIPECAVLRAALARMRFPKNPPRQESLTFEYALKFVEVALDRGNRSMALTQALQFDCGLRQIDVRGQWRKCQTGYQPKAGEIVVGGKIWTGLTLDRVNPPGELVIETSKTRQPVVHVLGECQLVMMALQAFSANERSGPVACRADGTPWPDRQSYAKAWREIADAAGIPSSMWNMDNRASAISEAAEAGVPDDDIIRQSGHADKTIERTVYKRRGTEISRRSQRQRRRFREQSSQPDNNGA